MDLFPECWRKKVIEAEWGGGGMCDLDYANIFQCSEYASEERCTLCAESMFDIGKYT